ncbi:MAG: hypothetical protein C4532_17580 [Candidatus Abyssobacteria bacterium SURF_17]|uniref:Xylose isomerase-like TIM barrel domain-containing protein n=1 Tax=Candidatus Abyssobacteria bacterium SURF_17 TaxID=2093361 RepID=A0A419EQL5_9BACT|nr:MAG: hypothetical protein C4532_17580 [Candidatus Abyssubacteria bacterium SURF_17]
MKRFIIGHNADPSNWRQRLEQLNPRCLEIFVPPRYCEGEGLRELHRAFEQMAQHPVARALEFASCHFPWGESANGYSRYNLVDDQYFFPLCEIARGFQGFCSELKLPPERSALNFHNLYELPRTMLEALNRERKLLQLRQTFLHHAHAQTLAAKEILELLDVRLSLANENNPPIGDGDRMSIVDVFAEDLAERVSGLGICTCMDLSHFFMTRFYYSIPMEQRPSFPCLELADELRGGDRQPMTFDEYLHVMKPRYFHVSDTKTPGTNRTCEGLPVGSGDTPWADVLPAMARYAEKSDNKLFLIIEIKGGHTEEGTARCMASEHVLRGLIEDCFSSGFLEAISEEEALP